RRGEGDPDAQAGQAPAHPASAGAPQGGAGGAVELPAGAGRRRRRPRLHLRRPGREHRHRRADEAAHPGGQRLKGTADPGKLAGGHLREPGEEPRVNVFAIRAIYLFEMHRWLRTIVQSVAAPVITTSLYFIVFGSAIGSHMPTVNGISYGAFIVPGLLMLS